jgi:hypothetical protein
MRVFERIAEPITADADGIALGQTPAGAGNLTLNGAAVVVENGNSPAFIGQAVLNPPRNVIVASDGNDAGVTFTVYGKDRSGKIISEVFAGPNAGSTIGNLLFAQVSRISISAAGTGSITVGWGATSRSPWMPLGNSGGPAGFRLLTVGNDADGADTYLETTSKNILRTGAMDGDYPGDGEVQVIDNAGSPFNEDIESVCLVPYAAVRLVAIGNTVPLKLRANPNYTK